MFDERAGVQVCHRLADLLLRVHHDRAVPGHRLFDGLARDQQESNSFLSGLNADFIATIEEHERMIVDVVNRRCIRDRHPIP